MKEFRFIALIFVGMLMLTISSCENKEGIFFGRIIIGITDDPFPVEIVEEASIRIFKVEAHPLDADEDLDMVLLSEDTMVFNLIQLRNGIIETLLDTEIIADQYDYFRLYVDEASLTIIDGDSYSVKVPSGSTSGIKVKIDPPVEVGEGLTEELILDFDLSESFVLNGAIDTPAGIKGFNFKPVIRVINVTAAGQVEGRVRDIDSMPINGVSVCAELESESYTTFTETDGYYNIIGLPSGIYTLTAEEDGYKTIVLNDVVVVAGTKTTRNITLLK